MSADTPLDFIVERESRRRGVIGVAKRGAGIRLWREGRRHRARRARIPGPQLDWYHFDVAARRAPAGRRETVETRMVPTQLTFRGAPHPRWWRFEDGDAYFDSPFDPEPNVLSMLLPEFFFIDINNWYRGAAAADRRAPSARSRACVSSTASASRPSRAELRQRGCRVGDVLAGARRGRRSGDGGGAFLYVPNIAVDVLDNDQVEEVVFTRDEEANLVWASERLVTLADGTQVRNGDGTAPAPLRQPTRGRVYRLRSDVPPLFHSLRAALSHALSDVRRNVPAARPHDRGAGRAAVPQPDRRRIVALNEAEVPRSGVRVRRTHRYARGATARATSGSAGTSRPRRAAPRRG